MWSTTDTLFEFILYLMIDNITKLFIINNEKKYRFDILIYECLILGFVIGFISTYHHVTYLLILLLFIHIIGTIYTEQRFSIIKTGITVFVYIFLHTCQSIIFRICHWFLNRIIRRSSPKILISRKLPKEFLYSYHLKPANTLQLQQSSAVQSLARPGIFNLSGTTCSLNSLLQSFATFNNFYSELKRNINFSRYNYDSVVPTFIDLLSQLRNDHHVFGYKSWNTPIDASCFISKFNVTYPDLLRKDQMTDIAELFQSIIELLNKTLSTNVSVCSSNVIEQVYNRKLTTFSQEYLNKLFLATQNQLRNEMTLDDLDSNVSILIQYVDVTWLLHHIQLGSIIKHTFSGQILHAYCCNNCSRVRFRIEPFYVLPLPINQKNATLEQIISKFTNIETIDSLSCSNCSSHIKNSINHGNFIKRLLSNSSSNLNVHNQSTNQISSTTSQSTTIPSIVNQINSRIKSQMMIANYPDILCIQLKRFSYDRLSNTFTKLKTNIYIEPEKIIDLSNIHYTTWLGLTNLSPMICSRYRLISVCLHLSKYPSLLSNDQTNSINGHYVCLYRTNHSQWFLSDDERMTEITHIENIFRTAYVTENCYLLFYERC